MTTKQYGIIRVLLCSVLSLWLLLSSAVGAWAAGCEFYLSDAQANVGRLFVLSLECEGVSELCAFVAELEYDATAVEYRSAKAVTEDSEFSINALQAGKLRLVCFSEEGMDCTDKTVLVEFTFKALQAGDSQVSATIQQAIDCSSSDIKVSSVAPAVISVTASRAGSSADKDSADNTDTNDLAEDTATQASSDTENSIIYVGGKPFSKGLVISAVAAALSLMCLVAFFAYKLGTHRKSKSKE